MCVLFQTIFSFPIARICCQLFYCCSIFFTPSPYNHGSTSRSHHQLTPGRNDSMAARYSCTEKRGIPEASNQLFQVHLYRTHQQTHPNSPLVCFYVSLSHALLFNALSCFSLLPYIGHPVHTWTHFHKPLLPTLTHVHFV